MKAHTITSHPTFLAAALALVHLASSSGGVIAAEAQRELEISTPGSPVLKLSAEQLLHHRTLTTLVLASTPGYGDMTLSFKAVPMIDLLPARYARPGLSLVFECLDGFAATIPAERVLGQAPDDPRAFLAIEDPRSPWPFLKKQPGATAGPFYLIWQTGPSMRVAPEEWPYQIFRISVREAAGEFRGIAPAGKADSKVKAGFEIFVRNCSPCHRLNGVGSGDVGPDLNSPMNPTEYFREGIFEKYVRDPGSLLRWPDQKMPSFPPDVLSDTELSQLRAYLATMARHKKAPPQE